MEDIACKYECSEGCWYWLPDSMRECVGHQNCKGYEKKMNKKFNVGVATSLKENQVLDNKFGLIDKPKVKLDKYLVEDENLRKTVIEGVGEDAEVITNAAGGKQSKAPMAMHLLDPTYLKEVFKNKAEELEYLDEGDSTCIDPKDMNKYSCCRAIECIADFMLNGIDFNLTMAMDELSNTDDLKQVISIAKILQYGAERYAPNNWRLIPEEEHINHALIHLVAHLAGDTQDDHINHALCRLMMAYATEKSKNFDYNIYIPMGA